MPALSVVINPYYLFLENIVAVHGLKLEIGNLEEQFKSMKSKFLISMFRKRLQILFILLSCQILFQKAKSLQNIQFQLPAPYIRKYFI